MSCADVICRLSGRPLALTKRVWVMPSSCAFIVIIAAKRARQLNAYHHMLGEGVVEDVAPPLVESRSKNYLTMSLEEVAQDRLAWGTDQ